MEFFETIQQVQNNWNPYKKWDIEQQKKEKQNEELRKKYPPTAQELKQAEQYGRTIITAINTMDQHSIDKSEDTMVAVRTCMIAADIPAIALSSGMGMLLQHIMKVKKGDKWHDPLALIGFTIGVSSIALIKNIWGAQIEKQASRIARYQTRENDLKDSRNFVVYNESQIEEAKKIAKYLPEVKESKPDITLKDSTNFFKNTYRSINTVKELAKDYSNYEEWKERYLKEEDLKKEKFANMNLSPNELKSAERDRDVMLETIKKIETSSLNYLGNMSLAIHLFNIAIFAVGTALGGGIYKLIDIMQKKNILKETAVIKNAMMAAPLLTPIVLLIAFTGPFAKMAKDAARIGRYKAKQDMLNHPENFIVYDEQQRKTITEIKGLKEQNKGFLNRIKEDMNSIKQLKNDYAEYQNYINTTKKEELKLREALKKVNITNQQKVEAVKLQKNAFHSFEKIDEKAQRFTDDTDAAVDTTAIIARSIISTTGKVLSLLFLSEKLVKHNHGKSPEGVEWFKLMKHLTPKEIGIVSIPMILSPFVSIPITLKGIQIKKDAGKIGVMTAMKDLDDPKNFFNK